MNLLEHYIVEVHDVKEYKKYPNMLEVDVTYDCYGDKKRDKHFTSKDEWETSLARGYFLA